LGWFNWLSSTARNVETPPDVIWESQAAKFIGIRVEIEEAARRDLPPASIYVVAHFEDCLRQLQRLEPSFSTARPLTICQARSLSDEIRAGITPAGGQGIDIIVAEHHPHPHYDDMVLQAAEALPYPCRLVYHLALDDALLRVFTDEWVIEFLRRAGMTDDEPIRSKMVSRRLRGAQKKVAKTATGDLPADSAEEWLKLNSPPSLERLQKPEPI
jgi:hypothetical protein